MLPTIGIPEVIIDLLLKVELFLKVNLLLKGVMKKIILTYLKLQIREFLKRIFPHSEVFLNPEYPGGNELCDVLVLHDRNVFIVQCKAKRLRYDSRIGRDSQLIRDDLNKAVKESFDQGVRARDYFSRNQPARIEVSHGNIEVDSKQISDIFLLSVTLGIFLFSCFSSFFSSLHPMLSRKSW